MLIRGMRTPAYYTGVTAQRFVDAFTRRGHEPCPEHEITAAVCVVLGGPDTAPALCFIKRSERPDDPWSGQMAFPGGRVSPTDADARTAGVRETAEEVGLDLMRCRYLGALQAMPITRRGRPHLGWLHPFVYRCSPEQPALRAQPSEVAAAMWNPHRASDRPGAPHVGGDRRRHPPADVSRDRLPRRGDLGPHLPGAGLSARPCPLIGSGGSSVARTLYFLRMRYSCDIFSALFVATRCNGLEIYDSSTRRKR